MNAATKKVNLSLGEYIMLLAANGQAVQLYLNDSLNFNKTIRPYTEAEAKNFACNTIYLLNENIKLTQKYPEYANVPNVKSYVATHQEQIVKMTAVKGNAKCSSLLVYTPKGSQSEGIPLNMPSNEGSQLIIKYYEERERLSNEINLATDEQTRTKRVCELIGLGVITEMNLSNYNNLRTSQESKQVFSTIKQDELNLRKKIPMLHKCG
ncbi:hypothetical protein [Acinetobacter sp. NIPH 298]|uniref:hypothetical protein n=1 Tax=Acinetobacter sp. NIPH 298 TaxID=1217692 RepID=UPI0012DB6508|nr:hypothetical protein [Acinetobacter sp. NIPH 298]